MAATASPQSIGQVFTSETLETVTVEACDLGRQDDGYAHDFLAYDRDPVSGPLLYCRRCGRVQKLELTED